MRVRNAGGLLEEDMAHWPSIFWRVLSFEEREEREMAMRRYLLYQMYGEQATRPKETVTMDEGEASMRTSGEK